MKKIFLLAALLLSVSCQAQSVLADTANHIYTDRQLSMQYKNCSGVEISCLAYDGEVVEADRLYINNVILDLINLQASFNWHLMYPEQVDSATVKYHVLIEGYTSIPMNKKDVIENALPSIYQYTAYRLPDLYGRIKFSLVLTEQ